MPQEAMFEQIIYAGWMSTDGLSAIPIPAASCHRSLSSVPSNQSPSLGSNPIVATSVDIIQGSYSKKYIEFPYNSGWMELIFKDFLTRYSTQA